MDEPTETRYTVLNKSHRGMKGAAAYVGKNQ